VLNAKTPKRQKNEDIHPVALVRSRVIKIMLWSNLQMLHATEIKMLTHGKMFLFFNNILHFSIT